MTFDQPLASQPGTLEETVFFDSLVGINRTGRVEAAVMTEERREEKLVAPDQK
jgi:hypothetical protein